MRRRYLPALLGIALLAVAILGAYVVWDEHRVVVRHVTLAHRDLPPAFDGYRFLQISDLHGSRFGAHQERLLALLRKERFDAVLFTGDAADVRTTPSEAELRPLTDILDGLPRGVPVYYVLGNWDAPVLLWGPPGAPTGAVAEALEAHGAKPLYPGIEIDRGRQRIFLTDWIYSEFGSERALQTEVTALRAKGGDERQVRFMERTYAFLQRFRDGRDFNIAVTHAPVDFDYSLRLAEDREQRSADGTPPVGSVWRMVDWKLAISGHTHAGQIRLPGIGPLLTSNGDGIISGTLFPVGGDRYVYGVHAEGQGRSQWISAGLGAGGPIPGLRFRLFDTPEVDIITLRRR